MLEFLITELFLKWVIIRELPPKRCGDEHPAPVTVSGIGELLSLQIGRFLLCLLLTVCHARELCSTVLFKLIGLGLARG